MERIKAAAAALGVNLVFLAPGEEFDSLDSLCPFNFNLAIRLPSTLVIGVIDGEFRRSNAETIGGCIHEMGHIVVAQDCGHTDEEEFIGWEYAVAKKFNMLPEWFQNMQDYGVELGELGVRSFGQLEPWLQKYYLQIHESIAVKKGYIVNGEPIMAGWPI